MVFDLISATNHCKVLFHQKALDCHLLMTLANTRLKLTGQVVDQEQGIYKLIKVRFSQTILQTEIELLLC